MEQGDHFDRARRQGKHWKTLAKEFLMRGTILSDRTTMKTHASRLYLMDSEISLPTNGIRVTCQGYPCLAYQDEEGNWRICSHGNLLPGPVEVLPSGGWSS